MNSHHKELPRNHSGKSIVAVMNGIFMLPERAEVSEKVVVESGDKMEDELALNTPSRVVELPADFKKALDKNMRLKNSTKNHVILTIPSKKACPTISVRHAFQ